ncbi:TolC family protein [Paraflavitalea soli]|uniref:TolC family protein n=1 Tax=Paraflavitalea soli TaxID=2315862 RepID=A0A3B7MT17_9BACT|nr:TolC family protein [Paraflavitalea soli]AXY76190.1 TolC family protein [Paraflavitalea soli]
MYIAKLIRTWCGGFLVVLCLPAMAQQQPIGLKELLARVAANAPALLTDSASIHIREAQEAATKAFRLPNLRLNYQVDAGTNNNMPGGYFSYGIVPGNSRVRTEGNANTILSDLGIAAFDWELYNFGGFEAQQKAAHAEVEVEQARFVQSKYQWQAYTIQLYLRLLQLHDLQAIQQLNIRRNQEIRLSIQSLAKSGIIAGVDTSIAEAELSRSRLIYLELGNQFKQLQLQLSAISGMPAPQLVPDTAFAQQLLQEANPVRLQEADTLHHPVIGYYRSLYRNSLTKEDLVRKSYYPKVSLQAAVWGRGASVSPADEFRPLSKGLGFERANYLVGLGVTYNIFDAKRKNLQLHTQKATTRYVQQQLSEQQNLLHLSISQANADLEVARERLQEIPHQLAAAQAAYRQKFSLYKNGLTNIVDLNAALNLLYRAETDYTNANYAWCNALFRKAVQENQVEALLNTLK